MLNKFEFVKSFDSSMNSKCGTAAHCSVLFTETGIRKRRFYVIWNYRNPEKVTILENLQNSREFRPRISGTVESREFLVAQIMTTDERMQSQFGTRLMLEQNNAPLLMIERAQRV